MLSYLNMNLWIFLAGSRFWQSGTFEVTKSEAEDAGNTDAIYSPHPEPSSLLVTVPSELEGIAYIQVAIRKLKGIEITFV